ncbi:MAG: hypothetical protein DYG98_20280 [Haliscomenobacteraceae bacterium CHB4]|nr:hypothetical protein [Saprospiraceae bacterium]MCE7925399.1 hypothetical protein [Haliscomenobacteraceae bacterium CHB4]
MIRAIYLFIFIGVGCATQAFSQHSDDARCGNVVWLHQQIVSDTLLRNKFKQNEIKVQNLLANKDLTSSERQQVTIPMTVCCMWEN